MIADMLIQDTPSTGVYNISKHQGIVYTFKLRKWRIKLINWKSTTTMKTTHNNNSNNINNNQNTNRRKINTDLINRIVARAGNRFFV